MRPLDGEEFARLMARLGPLPPRPTTVVGVSGGADSMALALLARNWARHEGGSVRAIIVNHGLRPAARLEASLTRSRLAALAIPSTILELRGVAGASGVERRARALRQGLLEATCREIGAVLLLLAHHAVDQAETVLFRAQAGSGAIGLAGMTARRERGSVVLLRPLLGVAPGRLRATLCGSSVGWIEDLSNQEPMFQRARLRRHRRDRAGSGIATLALSEASAFYGQTRATRERERNDVLAAEVSLYPEGFAKLSSDLPPIGALANLIRALSGANYPPSEAQLAAFLRRRSPGTLGGVRFLTSCRSEYRWLVVREAAAMAPPIAATPGAYWDRRFCLSPAARPPTGATLGPLGAEAAHLREASSLPSVVLETLPAVRVGEKLVAVPHLGYPGREVCQHMPVTFHPAEPLGSAPFLIA